MQLVLFTNKFPFIGGESFLETEIFYLAKRFDKVIIYPLQHGTEHSVQLPANCMVADFGFENNVSLKSILKRHFGTLLYWFLSEFMISPHRFKYITQFKWNLYRLVGLVDCAERLWAHAEQYNGQKVFCSYWFNEWGSVLAILKKKNSTMCFITRVHLYDFEEEFDARKYLPFRFTEMKLPDAIFPISEYGKQYLLKFRSNRKIEVHKLGVNILMDYQSPQKESPFCIVSCSQLGWYKRPLLLVELISKLKLNIEWHHFGDGVLQSEFLEACAKLPGNIKFVFHGHKPNVEVYNFYKQNYVSLFINVSEYEGIPVSIMEAISFGVPVVGCNICGVPEIVTDATGILLEKHFEIAESAVRIDTFLMSQAQDAAYRNGVQKFCETYYNAAINYPAFIDKLLEA
jgi:glycosyltransferase involved in cell wall biosynthesis